MAACTTPDPQTEKYSFVFGWDLGNPTFYDGFRFAEVLLNRETAFGPLGFGGFRALSDFRVRGIPPEPWRGGSWPLAMLRGDRGVPPIE